jgi:hypothetical protein
MTAAPLPRWPRWQPMACREKTIWKAGGGFLLARLARPTQLPLEPPRTQCAAQKMVARLVRFEVLLKAELRLLTARDPPWTALGPPKVHRCHHVQTLGTAEEPQHCHHCHHLQTLETVEELLHCHHCHHLQTLETAVELQHCHHAQTIGTAVKLQHCHHLQTLGTAVKLQHCQHCHHCHHLQTLGTAEELQHCHHLQTPETAEELQNRHPLQQTLETAKQD